MGAGGESPRGAVSAVLADVIGRLGGSNGKTSSFFGSKAFVFSIRPQKRQTFVFFS